MSHTTTPGPVIETKVTWATAASGIVAFILDAISNMVQNEDHGVLIKGLPDKLEPFVMALMLAAPTFLAGYQARHTHRPDLRNDPLVPPAG
jgi:hypothetical protein